MEVTHPEGNTISELPCAKAIVSIPLSVIRRAVFFQDSAGHIRGTFLLTDNAIYHPKVNPPPISRVRIRLHTGFHLAEAVRVVEFCNHGMAGQQYARHLPLAFRPHTARLESVSMDQPLRISVVALARLRVHPLLQTVD